MRLPSRLTGSPATSLTLLLSLLQTATSEVPPPPPSAPHPTTLQIEITHPTPCTRKTQPRDVLTIDYRGTLLDGGKQFDSSYEPGRKPFVFRLGAGQVIAGWDQGLVGMCIGEGRRLVIPPGMAYGERGAAPDIPSNAWLGE